MHRMLESVSRESMLTLAELCGHGRRRELVQWRRIAAYLAVTHLGASAAETGRLIGLTTSTVLVAVAAGPRLLGEMGLRAEALIG